MPPKATPRVYSCEASAIQPIYGADAFTDLSDSHTRACEFLPSFFIVGPPRTGTSWLHDVLNQSVNLPYPTKETRFFDLHFQRGIKWYRAHFPCLFANLPVGEIAPTYFASELARERIAQTVPEAKLIFVFRNPVQRIVSLYRIKRAYGLYPWSLEQALDQDNELIASGRYCTTLREWQRAFSKEQLLITIYEDLRTNPQSFVDNVTQFISVPRIVLRKSQLSSIHSSESMTEPRSYLATRSATAVADWLKARRLDKAVAVVRNSSLMKFFIGGGSPFADVPQAVLDRICEIFRPEVKQLETILSRDLSSWTTISPDSSKGLHRPLTEKPCRAA